jgi:2-(1,2-epoxy-1,2-dihydrophenyl)acetyl-CoA isomerase
MSDVALVGYTVTNHVATITLNSPAAMNAVSQRMRQELLAAIETAETDDDARVVVLNAAGRAFCSGADLAEGTSGYKTIGDQILAEYQPILMGINNSKKLYIASVKGPAAGIGSALAMVCDLAIMAEAAYLHLAFAGLSLVPDGGMSYHLVNALDYKKAMQLFAETAKLSATDCESYGLVNKVVAGDNLAEQAQLWAESLAQGAPLSHKLGKEISTKRLGLITKRAPLVSEGTLVTIR